MDGEIVVAVPKVVLMVVSVILNLNGSHILNSRLVGGVTERQPCAVHIAFANHTVGVVGLFEVAAFGPLSDFMKCASAGHHIEFLFTSISLKVLGLRVMVSKLYFDGWILSGDCSVVFTLKATEIVHLRVFALTSAPTVAFAVAHIGNIDIAPVSATARVGVVTRNGARSQR